MQDLSFSHSSAIYLSLFMAVVVDAERHIRICLCNLEGSLQLQAIFPASRVVFSTSAANCRVAVEAEARYQFGQRVDNIDKRRKNCYGVRSVYGVTSYVHNTKSQTLI